MYGMRKLLQLGFFFILLLLAAAPAPADETLAVTLVQINDLARVDDVAERGGLAKLATIIKGERAAGRQVLVVHAGNAISPSLLSGFDQGAHMMQILDRLGIDVMAFGNHEFDFGASVASGRALEATFPVILDNVRSPDGQPLAGLSPTWTYEHGGFRIAFIGLARGDLLEVSNPVGIAVLPPLAVAKREAEALRQAGADLVVALGALTDAEERALINSGTVDLVLGAGEQLHAAFDGRTAAAASGRNAEHVMLVDLTLERYDIEAAVKSELPGSPSGPETLDEIAPEVQTRFRWAADFRSVDTRAIDSDPDIVDDVQRYLLHLSKELDGRVGVADAELDLRNIVVRDGVSPFAEMVADAMRAAMHADAAIINAGAIRADQVVAAGTPITRRSLVQWLPFEDRTLLLRVSGEQLLAALENGVSQVDEHAGRFPIVSGLQVTFDPRRPVGDRVLTAVVGDKLLALDQTYALAVNGFIAKGGDGYKGLIKAARLVDLPAAKLLVGQVADYIAAAGGIDTKLAPRVRPTPVN
jgi:2',3'-cyclic-nucleotide 2'-phosphodiesterase (5'-nucleotidase family)